MSSRHKIYWRVYIYANSLYSLPSRRTCSFRKWNPVVFRRNSYELHRIMNWVYRDLSVLLRSCKRKMQNAYEAIFDLLPEYSMKHEEFARTLAIYLGDKTHHFLHELINFARSPYDDLISYECNVQYSTTNELGQKMDSGGNTQPAATTRMDGDLHNFVEFSRRINDDDCNSFEADLEDQEDNEEWEYYEDTTGVDLTERPLLLLRRSGSNIVVAQQPTQTGAPPPPPPPLPPQPPLSQPLPMPQPQYGRAIARHHNFEFGLAIDRARNVLDASQGDDEMNGGVHVVNPNIAREPGSAGTPADVMSAPPIPPSTPTSVVQNNRGGPVRNNRRKRKIGWGPHNMQ